MSRAKCRNCGEPIEFRPHPNNPAKLAPFNSDGEIHFATCSKRQAPEKKKFAKLSDARCDKDFCDEPAEYCFVEVRRDGSQQLTILCGHRHRHKVSIPHHPDNWKLVNISQKDAMEIRRKGQELAYQNYQKRYPNGEWY